MSALALELADVELELLALQDDAVGVAALAGARGDAGCSAVRQCQQAEVPARNAVRAGYYSQ